MNKQQIKEAIREERLEAIGNFFFLLLVIFLTASLICLAIYIPYSLGNESGYNKGYKQGWDDNFNNTFYNIKNLPCGSFVKFHNIDNNSESVELRNDDCKLKVDYGSRYFANPNLFIGNENINKEK